MENIELGPKGWSLSFGKGERHYNLDGLVSLAEFLKDQEENRQYWLKHGEPHLQLKRFNPGLANLLEEINKWKT